MNKAAKALKIAQPAISRQVLRLEDEFGTPLLSRTSHGVTPTTAGEHFNRLANNVLRSVDRLQVQMSKLSGHRSGTVRFGIPPSVGSMFMDPMLRNLDRHHPGIEVLLIEGSSFELETLLDEGELDLAILTDAHPNSRPKHKTMWREYMYFVRSAEINEPYFAHLPQDIDLSDIANVPLILTSRPKTVRTMIEAKYAEKNIQFNLKMEVEGVATIKNLVSHGHGFTILPYPTSLPELNSGEFIAHRIKELTTNRQIAWVRGVEPGEVARTVINALESEVRDIAAEAPWICS